MRIRTKTWARPELAACEYFVDEPIKQKGSWESFFPKKQPIHLDLGCGKCTFLMELAYRNKNINHIGIDISYDILGVARRNIRERFGEEKEENAVEEISDFDNSFNEDTMAKVLIIVVIVVCVASWIGIGLFVYKTIKKRNKE